MKKKLIISNKTKNYLIIKFIYIYFLKLIKIELHYLYIIYNIFKFNIII